MSPRLNLAGFSGAIGKLNEALEEFLITWEYAKEHWNDNNRNNFEEQYVIPLYQATRQAVDATRTFAETANKANRDCTRQAHDLNE